MIQNDNRPLREGGKTQVLNDYPTEPDISLPLPGT